MLPMEQFKQGTILHFSYFQNLIIYKQLLKEKLNMHHNTRSHTHITSQFDPEHPYIPLSMFLALPQSQDQYYVGQGKAIRRFLFEGTAHETYTQFQKQKYKEFLEYMQKNSHKLPANIVNNPFWNDEWKLRWLTSEGFENKNTIKAMEEYSSYLATNRFNVTPASEKYLKQGVFYVSGRDAYFRPILVFDIDKMIKLKMEPQELLESQKFFFEKVLNQYLLPGQVQNWVAIIDVGFQNLASLVSPMKASIGFLSNTFRNRMRIAYVVRIPGSLSFIWRIIKNFLHQDTAKKINFLDEQQVKPILQYANPSQLQVKYGGTQPPITQFWPGRTIDKLQQLNLLDFSHPDIVNTLLSKEAYKIKAEKGKLQGHTISKVLLQNQKKQADTRNSFAQLPVSPTKSQKNNQNNQIVLVPDENWKTIDWQKQFQPQSAPILSREHSVQWETLLH